MSEAEKEDGTPASLLAWFEVIERRVKEFCGEATRLSAKVNDIGSLDIEFGSVADAADRSCLLRVFKRNLGLMPPKTRAFFSECVREIEQLGGPNDPNQPTSWVEMRRMQLADDSETRK